MHSQPPAAGNWTTEKGGKSLKSLETCSKIGKIAPAANPPVLASRVEPTVSWENSLSQRPLDQTSLRPVLQLNSENLSLWLRSVVEPETPQCRIYWFAHAGGGTASLVRDAAGTQGPVSLRGVKLPGREERFAEPPMRDLSQLADSLADQITADADVPYALVGHSFGGLLAFRTAQKLIQRETPLRLLSAIAAPPPDRVHGGNALHDLPDDELAHKLDKNVGGMPERIRQDPVALRHFLPVVRADLFMLETYRHDSAEPPLPIPIVAFGGTNDTVISNDVLLGWRKFTSRRYTLRMLPGDHFFPSQHLPQMIATLAAACLQNPGPASPQPQDREQTPE